MRNNRHRNQYRQKGFTLLEVMLALVVLTVGVFALQKMQIASTEGNASAQWLTSGATWASDRAERLINLAYTDALLNDSNGDGVAGLDNTVSNAGVITADFAFTRNNAGNDVVTAGGNALPANSLSYTVYWNVATNAAVPNTKLLRIITVWGDFHQRKTTTLDYIKSNIP